MARAGTHHHTVGDEALSLEMVDRQPPPSPTTTSRFGIPVDIQGVARPAEGNADAIAHVHEPKPSQPVAPDGRVENYVGLLALKIISIGVLEKCTTNREEGAYTVVTLTTSSIRTLTSVTDSTTESNGARYSEFLPANSSMSPAGTAITTAGSLQSAA